MPELRTPVWVEVESAGAGRGCEFSSMRGLAQIYYTLGELEFALRFSAVFLRDKIRAGEFGLVHEVLDISGDLHVPLSGVEFFRARYPMVRAIDDTAKLVGVLELYYSVRELAFLLRFGETTIRRWLKEKQFGPLDLVLDVAGDIRVPASGVNEFTKAHPLKYDLGVRARNRGELLRKLNARTLETLAGAQEERKVAA